VAMLLENTVAAAIIQSSRARGLVAAE